MLKEIDLNPRNEIISKKEIGKVIFENIEIINQINRHQMKISWNYIISIPDNIDVSIFLIFILYLRVQFILKFHKMLLINIQIEWDLK